MGGKLARLPTGLVSKMCPEAPGGSYHPRMIPGTHWEFKVNQRVSWASQDVPQTPQDGPRWPKGTMDAIGSKDTERTPEARARRLVPVYHNYR